MNKIKEITPPRILTHSLFPLIIINYYKYKAIVENGFIFIHKDNIVILNTINKIANTQMSF